MDQNSVAKPAGSDVTMVKEAIHNPSNPLHFMRLKPCKRDIRIWRGDTLLVDTNQAVRLLEVGRDVYDPVFYVPSDAVLEELVPIPERTTHCPLKGDASYFRLKGDTLAEDQYLAWSYDEPFDFAAELAGFVAFNADLVRVEEFTRQA